MPALCRWKEFFTAKILPISQRYSSYNNVRKIQYNLDLRCPIQTVSSWIKFISTIYITREKLWCTSAWMLIYILSVCSPFSLEITMHRWVIWISYVSMEPGIYMSISLIYVAFTSLNYPYPYKDHPDSYPFKTQERKYDVGYGALRNDVTIIFTLRSYLNIAHYYVFRIK